VNQLSGYTNGSGQTSVISGVLGGEIQITDRLRADIGVRGEYDKFVQSAENTSTFDLDGNPATTYNNETFGNGSFRHFSRGLDDWSGSLGLNYTLGSKLSLYAAGARGFKMPALDEFLNATAEQQVDLFESKRVESVEGGVKGFVGSIGFTVGGFWTQLSNVVSQGLVIDTLTGGSSWIIVPSPDNKSWGTEIELVANPLTGLQLLGSATILKAELGTGAGADIGSRIAAYDVDRPPPRRCIDPVSGVSGEGGFPLGGRPRLCVKAGVTLPAPQLFQLRGRICAQEARPSTPPTC
jgi:outer membrane receptor protein involved in Fe transport